MPVRCRRCLWFICGSLVTLQTYHPQVLRISKSPRVSFLVISPLSNLRLEMVYLASFASFAVFFYQLIMEILYGHQKFLTHYDRAADFGRANNRHYPGSWFSHRTSVYTVNLQPIKTSKSSAPIFRFLGQKNQIRT